MGGRDSEPAVPHDSSKDYLDTRRNWVAFALLGWMNNFAYVVVLAGAQSLADDFNKHSLIGVIAWANVGFGSFIRLINTIYLENMTIPDRLYISLALFMLGLGGVALSEQISFWMAVASISLIGCGCSLGESLLLSYLRKYPTTMTGAWGTGTGFAGVGGALFYLGLSSANLSNATIFLFMLPTVLVHHLAFRVILSHPIESDGDENVGLLPQDPESGSDVQRLSMNSNVSRSSSMGCLDKMRAKARGSLGSVADAGGEETTWQRLLRVNVMVGRYSTQLALVYFFEYVASVGAAADATDDDDKNDYFHKHAYTLLTFCYQFGVLMSRSSLSLLRIRRIELLTMFQAINFVLWMLQAKFMIVGVWVEFVGMVWVGLLGGAMYVNAFATLMEDPKVEPLDREMGINLVNIWVNVGIMASSVFDIVMDATFMK